MKKLLLLFFVAMAIATFAQNQINFEQGNFDFFRPFFIVNY
ncbi:hypothetical protein C8D70_109124 [Chryseobacterium sp. CBTAP 102]|jgi:hypothetical protein|nr:hypothetical protein C8D70_109124 [Chryseobacterium sp. CBTAP 102]SIQ44076.1 hypothetical protein SAMN05880573_105171 [Chryseobacterium sp. RU33C]